MKTPPITLSKPHHTATKITSDIVDTRIPPIVENQLNKFVNTAKQAKLQTPYMLTDLSLIEEKCHRFKAVFPDVKLFYAIKCFSDLEVIETVDSLVDGYDVASVAEIKKLLSLGIDPQRMTFSNPVKSEQTISEAAKLGVSKFAYQSQNELIKIKKYSPNAEVYLRVKVADHTSSITFSSKFGCNYKDAKDLLILAKTLGLRPTGLTFHVGSQATVSDVWRQAIQRCSGIIEDARAEGLDLSILNLGGGFPVRYNSDDPFIEGVGMIVSDALKENLADQNMAVMAEPGRYLVADSSVIISTVIGVEERDDTTWLFLDVGTFQAFIEVFEFGYFPYPVYSVEHIDGKLPVTKTKSYVLTGPSCDSYDTMSLSVELPDDLAIGHRIMIGVTGAYTIEYGSNFNGFEIPPRKFFR